MMILLDLAFHEQTLCLTLSLCLSHFPLFLSSLLLCSAERYDEMSVSESYL